MGMHLIASSIVTVDGTSNINFNSIPQTYRHLELYIYGRGSIAGTFVNAYCRFSGDAGVNYNGHTFGSDGANTYTGSYTGYDAHEMGVLPLNDLTADCYGVYVMSILDYRSTDKIKTIRTLNGFDVNTSGQILMKSGLWRNTAAVSSISITYPPFKAGTRFDLYGIEGSGVTGL
jgi:hypothetical protein